MMRHDGRAMIQAAISILTLAAVVANIFQGKRIMTTQAELAQGLTDINAQVGKIAAETNGLKDKVAALETEIANAGGVSPEVQAAFDAVKASVQSLDDLVPDAPAPAATDPSADQPAPTV